MEKTPTNESISSDCIHSKEMEVSLRLAAEAHAAVCIHRTDLDVFNARLIHLYHNLLIIDQFSRPAAAAEMLPGQPIECQIMLAGRGLYAFRTVWAGRITSTAQYGMKMPEVMNFLQRRQFIRIVPSRIMPAELISMFNKTVLPQSKVENISLGGVCLSFARESSVRIGSLIPQIRLYLNRINSVSLDGVVRSKLKGRFGRFSLGIEWKNPIFSCLETIKRYVVDRQRQDLRRRH